jgi:hypothetical protein
MKLQVLSAAVLLAAVLAPSAQAQQMKPGLWEVTNKMNIGNTELAKQMEEMRKSLANMPPEQRKAMDEMMAKHGAGAMPEMSADGAMKVKVCISPKMAAQQELPIQRQGTCTSKRSPAGGNTIKVSYTCTRPASTGEATIRFNGDTSYTMDLQAHQGSGSKRETTTMNASGKWLGADCGSIKPMEHLMPAAPVQK